MATKKKVEKAPSSGDHYEIKGNVDHGGIAIQAPHSNINVNQQTGIQAAALTAMFEAVFKKIDTLPTNPDVDKDEIVETVQKIQNEANKENQANPNKLERWLTSIAQMAPDILDVMAASLVSPISGVAVTIKKIVDKARQAATP